MSEQKIDSSIQKLIKIKEKEEASGAMQQREVLATGGTLAKSRYLQMLDSPEDYSDLSFSPQETAFIRKKLSHLSTGSFAAIPLICQGNTCPFGSNCPFYQISKMPEGRSCPVELNLLKEWTIRFIEEYEVDPGAQTDRFFVQELAETELLLYRINSNLAKAQYGELVAESVSNVDREGNVFYEEKIIPLMELKLKLTARKDRVIKLMVGDRQEKYKKKAALKQKDESDFSNSGAKLKRSLKQEVIEVTVEEASSPEDLISQALEESGK